MIPEAWARILRRAYEQWGRDALWAVGLAGALLGGMAYMVWVHGDFTYRSGGLQFFIISAAALWFNTRAQMSPLIGVPLGIAILWAADLVFWALLVFGGTATDFLPILATLRSPLSSYLRGIIPAVFGAWLAGAYGYPQGIRRRPWQRWD